MKTFLIILNICLAGGIFLSVLKEAKAPQVNEDEYFFRKTEKDKKKPAAKADTVSRSSKKSAAPETRDSAVSIRKVVEGNIFDPARCPGARIPGRRNSNAGLDMTLVGTFTIGELSGAVIMQKRKQNTNYPYPWMQGMGGMPMAMPAFQGNGQGGGFNNNRQGGAGGNGAPGNAQGGGYARTRFGAGDMYARWRRMQARQQNADNNNKNEAAVVYQQYVRVGETLANGYKLTAVTRTSATLMKNSEKIELELVEASRNAGADRGRNNNNPSGSQWRGMGMMPPWMMMPGMMMPGMMGGGMGGRGGYQQNGGGYQQQNGGSGRNGGGSRGSRQGRSRGQ